MAPGMSAVPQTAVVVPVLNEAQGVNAVMQQARQLMAQGAHIVFVDGGSADGTPHLLRQNGFEVLVSGTGRARQMNTGARHAPGGILLFLHADTTLPEAALDHVAHALAGRRVWGRFDVHIAGHSRWLPMVAFMMNRRSRCSGIATGDQALFMTRAAFDAVGGFPELPLMEDIEMSRALKRLSRPVCLRCKATTSGRRWDTRGVWRTILLMWRLRWAYWRGTSAEDIARAYH